MRLTTLLFAICVTLFGQHAIAQDKPIRLVLTPRKIETPVLKHRLMPAEWQLRDGNAAPILLRMPWEQTNYMSKIAPKLGDSLEKPIDHADVKIETFPDIFVDQMRRAAYRRTASWEYPIHEEPAAYILLPDIQGSRNFAGRGMSVWIRHKILDGDLNEAREGILISLAVSRHYARTPFVITQLVCAAIQNMAFDRVDEFIAHPDAPNLYWALTALPSPMLSIRQSFEFEEQFLTSTLTGLKDVDDLETPRTKQEWSKILGEMVSLMEMQGHTKEDSKATQLKLMDAGRKLLPKLMKGEEDRIEEMPHAEIAVRWAVLQHREISQQATAITALDPPEAIKAMQAYQASLKKQREDLGVNPPLAWASPFDAYVAMLRVRRRIEALRTVEAIRHFAAIHGRAPDVIREIKELQIPNDPLTGKPFRYETTDNGAKLSGEGVLVNGVKKNVIEYRIELRK